jgi:hypothetical protein
MQRPLLSLIEDRRSEVDDGQLGSIRFNKQSPIGR